MIKTTDISLEQVVDCYLEAFPNSIYNLFGRDFLSKVFQWYLDGSDLKYLFVYEENNIIMGFLTARMKSYKGNFAKFILPQIYKSLLQSPLLLLNTKIIKKGIRYLIYFIKKIRLVNETQNNNILLTISLGVNPTYRRKKIGSKLLKAAEYIAISKRCSYIETSGIDPSNKESILWHNKNHWLEVGLDKKGYMIYNKVLDENNKNIDLDDNIKIISRD